MNSEEFDNKSIEIERRLERASKLYHKCLGTVLEKFMQKDPEYQDVSKHCIEQKRRVDTLLSELRDFT